MQTAIISGVSGQDGSYLAEFLLQKGYRVIGVCRRKSSENMDRIEHLFINENFILEKGDITDESFLGRLIQKYKPEEFYNLAAMSFVFESWNTPIQTMEINAVGVLKCLEAIRHSGLPIKFYQASTSEMYGNSDHFPQNENTPFHPRSPYGIAKLASYWLVRNYRESFGIFACNGILFNHSSPRRGLEFATRKITDGAARIKLGLAKELRMGDIHAQRDEGHAKDYVEAMWLMLQHHTPDDYVIASGETHSIQEALEVAFSHLGLKWQDYVVIDKQFMRPAEIHLLKGDSSKARKILGWKPKHNFKDILTEMTDSDMLRVRKEIHNA
jgi:GDPmannose 4,6-dehydratase